MLITANFKKKIFSFFSKCNHNSERITEAYDRIERLEYRVVELENQIKELKNKC
jgi:hypothetical protein